MNWPTPSPKFPTDGNPLDQRRLLEQLEPALGPAAGAQPLSDEQAGALESALHGEMGVVDGVPTTMLEHMGREEATRIVAVGAQHGVPPTTLSTLYGLLSLENSYEAAHPANVLTMTSVWPFVANEVLRTSLIKAHGAGVVGDAVRRARALKAASLAAGSTALGHYPACDLFNITCDIHRTFSEHLPLVDGDNDYFAGGVYQFRGSSWRGRDCADDDATVYPGRAVTHHPPSVDHNCNGISGVNASGIPYEEAWCSGANAPMGVGILGDSATAHFHIPPQYINAQNFSLPLDRIIAFAANEADWPQCSWSTGFRDSVDCPATVDNLTMANYPSIYGYMNRLNKCNHRDLQNTGVNGARVGSVAAPDGIMYSLARNQTMDHPMLVFWALIGNDVCNGHPGSSHMTTVPEFKTAVLKGMEYLDTILPAGSHVAFMPLVDGRVLWDNMHDRVHPLGVHYPAVYEFLSCTGSNPCWGWLNTNEVCARPALACATRHPTGGTSPHLSLLSQTWRDFTSARAANLSAVYEEVHREMAYKHFDTHVLSVDWVKLIGDFEREYNGEGWQLIEPCVFPLLAPACHLPCGTARDLSPAQRGRLPPATARPPSPGSRRVEGLADQHHMASRGQPMEQCHRGTVRKPRRVLIRSCRQGGQVRTSLVTGQRSANPLLCSAAACPARPPCMRAYVSYFSPVPRTSGSHRACGPRAASLVTRWPPEPRKLRAPAALRCNAAAPASWRGHRGSGSRKCAFLNYLTLPP